jgi:phosphoribosylglycinamide formyltransferase-1
MKSADEIIILTYDVPHRKSFDIMFQIYLLNLPNNIHVMASKMSYVKKLSPHIEHRPPVVHNIFPEDLSRMLGFKYSYLDEQINKIKSSSIIIVAGSGILDDNLLENHLVINSHPGYLPMVRGLDAAKWAIYYDLPLGATVHRVTNQVDSGPVLLREEISIESKDTLYSIFYKIYDLEISLLIRSLNGLISDKLIEYQMIPESNVGPLRKRMPNSLELKLFDKINTRIANASSS